MLQDVCLLNMNTDLDVTVRETSGAERHFIVSAASFRSSAPAAPGSSFAIGKVRDVSGGGVEQPLVATATRTWQLSRDVGATRSEEHTSELPSLMRISYAVFCLKNK